MDHCTGAEERESENGVAFIVNVVLEAVRALQRFTGICKVGPDTALNCGSSIARKLHGSQLLGTLSGTDILHNILIAIR